jgi:predicted SnoaL-like aldol condensation-catalyzing enzyme
MTVKEVKEAERIAEELYKIHSTMVAQGQDGLHPGLRQTWKLARAIHLFGAVAEAVRVTHKSKGAMEGLLATL